jgi:hypothetical protein
MPRARQRLCDVAVLLAVSMVACSGGPTSPTNVLPRIPTLSTSFSALDEVGETRRCTFGAGYWKKHPWPARFDPNAIFYTSGKHWVDVLNTPPEGDAYYILAHQFIAAGLNLDHLDPSIRPSEIGEPWRIAESGYFTEGAHSTFTRTEILELATLLESFNDGNQGVPPCP